MLNWLVKIKRVVSARFIQNIGGSLIHRIGIRISLVLGNIFVPLGLFLFLIGCESKFAGDRIFDIQALNSPHRIKFVELNGVNYLAVINSNSKNDMDSGSLHFYSLANPEAPQRVSGLSLKIPSLVSDLAINNTELFLVDRRLDLIRRYSLDGGAFVERMGSDGEPDGIRVTAAPQRLHIFDRLSDGHKILAVTCQRSGFVHFIDLTDSSFVSQGAVNSAKKDVATLDQKPGANLYMVPRRTEKEDEDDPLDFSSIEAGGYGINGLVVLPSVGTEQIIAVANYLAPALFGFRFDTFTNDSNLGWSFPEAFRGTDTQPGTEERGFRGIAVDKSGNVYLSNRSDNGLYRVLRSELERSKVTDVNPARNTRGFPENGHQYQIATFDRDLSDRSFPRVGDIALDCIPGQASCSGNASRAWILGTSSRKVYRVDLLSPAYTVTESSELEGGPQSILWHSGANLLYVTLTGANKILLMNPDTLTIVSEIKNP